MFYFTRNFERQKSRLRKAKKIYSADADADVNADAEISKWPYQKLLKCFWELTRDKRR